MSLSAVFFQNYLYPASQYLHWLHNVPGVGGMLRIAGLSSAKSAMKRVLGLREVVEQSIKLDSLVSTSGCWCCYLIQSSEQRTIR